MKLSQNSWFVLVNSITNWANSISNKTTDINADIDLAVKNGSAETIIGMITELESNLRILKRRLQESCQKG